MSKQLQVTSLKQLQTYAEGTIVQLPDFADSQPFVARVRRPSLLVLAKSGQIPNSLMSTANKLFSDSSQLAMTDEKMLSDVYDVIRLLVDSCLLEPTLEEIESTGLVLTDEQMMAIFQYTQNGIKALEPFRTQ